MRAINSLIFVGGLGSNQKSMELASEHFGEHFEDVSPIPFRLAMKDEDLHRKLKGHPVATHSAGMLPVIGGQPEQVWAFGPPVPTTPVRLVVGSIEKSSHLLTRSRQERDSRWVWGYQAQTTKELMIHPLGNLRHLGRIAQFDALNGARALSDEGVASTLVWTHQDDYFRPDINDIRDTESRFSVDVHFLAGEHDELLVRPRNVLSRVFGG